MPLIIGVIRDKLKKFILKLKKKFKKIFQMQVDIEKIKKIQLIDENFSIENGLLTPTMKVKRKKVTEKYKKELENLY